MARETRKLPNRFNWRLMFGILGLAAIAAATAMAGYKVRHYLIADRQFELSRYEKDALTIQGLAYASRSKVQRVFAADFDHSVFLTPLEERRRRLLAIDWVEDASVSRVWPAHLVVNVRERKPVAFVNFRAGVLLIDSQGVLLEPPLQAQFAFPVLSGVGEGESEQQRRDHVRSFLQVEEDLGYLAKQISEVDVADAENIRLISQVEDRLVTLLMGDGNYARRYQNFVKNYPEIRRRSPAARIFDLRLDDRITVKE